MQALTSPRNAAAVAALAAQQFSHIFPNQPKTYPELGMGQSQVVLVKFTHYFKFMLYFFTFILFFLFFFFEG